MWPPLRGAATCIRGVERVTELHARAHSLRSQAQFQVLLSHCRGSQIAVAGERSRSAASSSRHLPEAARSAWWSPVVTQKPAPTRPARFDAPGLAATAAAGPRGRPDRVKAVPAGG